MDQHPTELLVPLATSRLQRLFLTVAMLALCVSAAVAAGQPAPAQPSADFIIVNARVYTVDPGQPWAEAVAIREDKILAVGSNDAIRKYRRAGGTPATQVIDAGGRLLLPGFTDSHVHFMDGSLSLSRINLEDTHSVAEIQHALKSYAEAHPATTPDSAWILGRGWSYPEFPDGLPKKEYIDAVVPDRPVFLEGFDGHSYWANSKALELAGITRQTPDPPNGLIVRDPVTGEPTGALKEDPAGDLVAKVTPKPTREQRLEALRAGIAHANRLGVVRVHSCGGDFQYLDLWEKIRREGGLSLRIYMAYFLDPPALTPAVLDKIEDARRRYHDDWIEGGVVKTMLDGVVETHTAAMLAPYGDDPSLTGKLFWEPQRYREAVLELDRRGIQVFTHAIGDRAVRLALDTYAEARRVNHTRDARDRIEHIETITAEDIPRFGKLGVIASMQPLHAYPDDDTLKVWARNAGPDRASRGWAWRSIASAGGRLAFGSD